ncbi:MAG: hypothetical protein AAFQ80_08420 [Cyanobacteria bacterium J06621_8]
MLRLSAARNHQMRQLPREKIDLEIPNRDLKIKLPRHISCLASDYSNCVRSKLPDQAARIPRSCELNSDSSQGESINRAVDILQYQLKDRTAQQKHLANLLKNLQRRLQVATASGNQELVSILQQEFTELSKSV